MDKQQAAEVWRPVVGYEGYYEVSSKGGIRSLNRYVDHKRNGKTLYKGKIMQQSSHSAGYKMVGLRKGGLSGSYLVYVLEGVAFIPNPENKPYINHKNGIKWNNRLENLEWSTPSENIKHAYDKKLKIPAYSFGNKNSNSKLSEAQVIDIRRRYAEGNTSHYKLGTEYKVHPTTIRLAITGKNWSKIK